MALFRVLGLRSKFWLPKADFVGEIVDALNGKVLDGDVVVVSEKAVSTALGYFVDESNVKAGFWAHVLANFWMRVVWGYALGVLCGFGSRLLARLRNYPLVEGARHKQVSLWYSGVLNALMFGSEGGLDGSNLPFSLVSLPLPNVQKHAELIQRTIKQRLGKEVTVMIVDTDKTFQFRNFFFTPRPKPMKGIHSYGGVFTFVLGRMLRLKRYSTPLAVAGTKMHVSEALKIANIADRVRGAGGGATVWDMAARFGVENTQVTWDMLKTLKHKPVILVRKEKR
jgi:F420-0:gamma-glutamyl ligase-like protein